MLFIARHFPFFHAVTNFVKQIVRLIYKKVMIILFFVKQQQTFWYDKMMQTISFKNLTQQNLYERRLYFYDHFTYLFVVKLVWKKNSCNSLWNGCAKMIIRSNLKNVFISPSLKKFTKECQQWCIDKCVTTYRNINNHVFTNTSLLTFLM